MIVGLTIRMLDRSNDGLTYGLIYGLLFGLIFGLRGSRQNPENDIQTVEDLRWSWRKALQGGLFSGLIFGILGGLYGLISGLRDGLLSGLLELLSIGLVLGLFATLVGAVFTGLSREIRESKSIVNQGIWLSIRSAIFAGLLVGLIYGLIGGLVSGGPTWLRDTLNFGLMGALWYGGLDVIQHYVLRLLLLIQEHTPANYARFLDYAVDRIFLQKVGGGYRFIHRLLLEHFAEMDETKKVSPSKAGIKRS